MKEFLIWFFTSEMSVDSPGPSIKGPPVVFVILLALVIKSCVWVARDADRRGKKPSIAVLFVLLAWWPFSLLWWKWLRPQADGKTPPPLP